MKMTYRTACFAVLIVGLCTLDTRAQVTVNPQVGFNASRLSIESEDPDAGTRVGYQVGVNLRIGTSRFYLQPGVFLFRSTTELVSEANADDLTDEDFNLSAIHVPALIGTNVVDVPAFRLRLNAGPAATFVTNIGENGLGLEADDFNGFVAGLKVGLGVDVAFISFDVDYEAGISDTFADDLRLFDVFDAGGIRNNVLRFNVGFVIG